MKNTMNIYKRKDGRFEGRIPFGRDDNGNLKYRYLYSRNLTELKEKMLYAYTTSEKYHLSFAVKPCMNYRLNGSAALNCVLRSLAIAVIKR